MPVVTYRDPSDYEAEQNQNDMVAVSTFLRNMRNKQQQNQAARMAAQGELVPEYSFAPGGATTTYKRQNVKEMAEMRKAEAEANKLEAESRLLQYKLQRAMEMQGGGAQMGDNSDMYPKTYKPDPDTGVPSPATYGSRYADTRKRKAEVIKKMLGEAETKDAMFRTTQDLVGEMQNNFNSSLTSPVERFEGGAPGQVDDIVINMLKKGGKGVYRKAAAAGGYDTNLGQYLSQRQGYIGNVARSVGAEKGVLTDPDIQRIYSLLPSEFSNKQEAQKKFAEINKTIKASLRKNEIRKRHYMSGADTEPEMPVLQFDPVNESYALVFPDGRFEEI